LVPQAIVTGTWICSPPLNRSVAIAGSVSSNQGLGQRAHGSGCVGRAQQPGLGDDLGEREHAHERRCGQALGAGGEQPSRPNRGLERGPGVRRLPIVVEASGRERRRRCNPALLCELEGHQATERVAGDVGALYVVLIQELADQAGERRQSGRRARRWHRRASKTRQIKRDDVALGCEPSQHRLPHLPAAPDPMKKDERRALAGAMMLEVHARRPY